jgi:DNA-binding protein Fis
MTHTKNHSKFTKKTEEKQMTEIQQEILDTFAKDLRLTTARLFDQIMHGGFDFKASASMYRDLHDKFDEALMTKLMALCNNNKTMVSRVAGINRGTTQKIMKKYGI